MLRTSLGGDFFVTIVQIIKIRPREIKHLEQDGTVVSGRVAKTAGPQADP